VECARRRQNVTLDVMPLLGGFLPLPSVRLSKYIPADVKRPDSVVGTASSIPKLEPFAPGQVSQFKKLVIIQGTCRIKILMRVRNNVLNYNRTVIFISIILREWNIEI
jgi:hypothetical protein